MRNSPSLTPYSPRQTFVFRLNALKQWKSENSRLFWNSDISFSLFILVNRSFQRGHHVVSHRDIFHVMAYFSTNFFSSTYNNHLTSFIINRFSAIKWNSRSLIFLLISFPRFSIQVDCVADSQSKHSCKCQCNSVILKCIHALTDKADPLQIVGTVNFLNISDRSICWKFRSCSTRYTWRI